MANIDTYNSTMQGIADAIRSKTGKTDKLTIAQMPTEIDSISAGGDNNVNVSITASDDGTYSGGGMTGSISYIQGYIRELDVSAFDTSAIINMKYMFNGCFYLTSLDLSTWNTASVTKMDGMFGACYSLTSLTLGSDWASNSSIKTFDLSACPLTHDSCLDVFNKLATKTSSATLTLNSTTKALMSEDEIKIATDKGWTVS